MVNEKHIQQVHNRLPVLHWTTLLPKYKTNQLGIVPF